MSQFTNYDARMLRECADRSGLLAEWMLDLAYRIEAAAAPNSPDHHEGHMHWLSALGTHPQRKAA